jgi:hypothetical protein
MPAIPKNDAMEKLARAVEAAPADVLVEIYAELFPEKRVPDVSGAGAKVVAADLALRIRAGIEPEEITDLWNVVFPTDRHVHYDEESEVVRYNEGVLWYAEQ